MVPVRNINILNAYTEIASKKKTGHTAKPF